MVLHIKGCIAFILKVVAALKKETVRITKTSAVDPTPTLCHYPKI